VSQTVVVDYGMGNLRSVAKAMEHVCKNQRVIVSSKAEDIENADRVVFPGQGAARDCMHALSDRRLNDVILKAAREKPFLGICMGLQVLMEHSEENNGVDCLGLYKGDVRNFDKDVKGEQGEKLKIPHMGWNTLAQTGDHPLWQGIKNNSRFYFVHSYYIDPEETTLQAATTQYGIAFVSAIARDYVFAVQCHPEKSAQDGLQLLKNFSRWKGQ